MCLSPGITDAADHILVAEACKKLLEPDYDVVATAVVPSMVQPD
jgi:hypothetical protein